MKKAVTFGELMVRLNPPANERFVQAEEFEVSYAGGEANVAVSLANYGVDAAFVTKLPQHEIGQAAVNLLRHYGVDTRHILRGGPRLGVYYVEKGASQRPSKVIYDRAGSSVALSLPGEYDWDAIFKDVDWFHFTGITPALGGALPQICEEACKSAKANGVTVSCDLNYRGKLWTRGQANIAMGRLMQYVDVCIANEEDAADVFNIHAASTDVKTGKLNRDGYTDVARQLTERFGCKAVAITLRGSISASINEWAGMLYQDGNPYFSPNYTIQIVDRVGGGDSFAGALLYALLMGKQPQDAIDFAVAASCLKHTIEHDFNLVSIQEVEQLAAGNGSGRVQR